MVKIYDKEKIFETLERIKDETTGEKSFQKIGSYLKKMFDALDVNLVDFESLPAELFKDDIYVYNDLDFSESSWISILPPPSKEWKEISSIMISPYFSKGSDSKSIYIFYGEKSHQQVEEEIVPLKSAGETIGVTVRQTVKEIPDRTFGREEIELLKGIVETIDETNDSNKFHSENAVDTEVSNSKTQVYSIHEEEESALDMKMKIGIIEKIKSMLKI